jgi:hypothetical protein
VRAEVLAALLLGARQPEPGCVAAVRLRGALIIGQLDLSCAEVKHTVLLEGCSFEAEPCLDGARTRLVNLSRSHLPGLQLSHAQVDEAVRDHALRVAKRTIKIRNKNH